MFNGVGHKDPRGNLQETSGGNVVDDVYKWHDELTFARRWYETYLLAEVGIAVRNMKSGETFPLGAIFPPKHLEENLSVHKFSSSSSCSARVSSLISRCSATQFPQPPQNVLIPTHQNLERKPAIADAFDVEEKFVCVGLSFV